MPRSRRTALIAAALIIAAIAWWRWPSTAPVPAVPDSNGWAVPSSSSRQFAQSATAPAQAGGTSAPAIPGGSPPATPVGTASPEATVNAEQALVGQAQVVALARQAADGYREQAQYPPWSHPFSE